MAKAIDVQEAPVGQGAPGAPITFSTQEAKDAEAIKAFSELAAKYSGSDEGYIAEYYLGCIAADQGKLGDADKRFSSVAEIAGAKYASLAKLSLGQLYFAEGKPADGEKILRSLIDNPTVFVSKDQATYRPGQNARAHQARRSAQIARSAPRQSRPGQPGRHSGVRRPAAQ